MYNKDQYNITRHEKKNHNLEHVLHNRLVLCLASRRVWLSRSFLCISYVSFLPLEQRHPTFSFQNPLCTHKYGTDFCFSFLDHLPFLVFSFFFLASDSTQHSDETHAVSCTQSRSDAQRLLVAGKQFFFSTPIGNVRKTSAAHHSRRSLPAWTWLSSHLARDRSSLLSCVLCFYIGSFLCVCVSVWVLFSACNVCATLYRYIIYI